jgi:phage virion morphogenesis protein
MTGITIEVDDKRVNEVIAELVRRVDDLSPAMRQIAGTLAAGIEQAFEREADPTTLTPWQRLSAVTIARREAAGHWPGKKLQVSGRLVSSIVPSFGPDFAQAGTNVPYATTMHFGAAQGAFGRTSRGGPIPWGDIPPRPFMGMSEETADDVLAIVGEYLASATA